MICPLKLIACGISCQKGAAMVCRDGLCDQSDCAWWSDYRKCCAVTNISDMLASVIQTVRRSG